MLDSRETYKHSSIKKKRIQLKFFKCRIFIEYADYNHYIVVKIITKQTIKNTYNLRCQIVVDCSTNNQKAEQIKLFYSTTLPLGAKKLINLTNLKIKPFVVKTFRLNEKMYLLPLSNKKIRFLLINCKQYLT